VRPMSLSNSYCSEQTLAAFPTASAFGSRSTGPVA
jgi:hypothetical protein